MAYSGQRTDSIITVLALGRGAFIGVGIVATYCLRHALWLNEHDTGKALAGQ